MLLFDEVDLQKTAINVDDFFQGDYNRLQRMATVSTLKATSYDGVASSGSTDNPLEGRYVKRAWATQVIEAVTNSIEACDEMSKTILKLKYQKHFQTWQIVERVNYSGAGYDNLRIRACNQFADAFEVVAEPLLGENSDLHVYKNINEDIEKMGNLQ